ncbi:hypothetical protein GGR50DRAFT_43011 [Xylaria sp. CBS 124048]|nr:hypothetical protein GGR50DRAFT_43011 [Xylaria sp. CBS 124048]
MVYKLKLKVSRECYRLERMLHEDLQFPALRGLLHRRPGGIWGWSCRAAQPSSSIKKQHKGICEIQIMDGSESWTCELRTRWHLNLANQFRFIPRTAGGSPSQNGDCTNVNVRDIRTTVTDGWVPSFQFQIVCNHLGPTSTASVYLHTEFFVTSKAPQEIVKQGAGHSNNEQLESFKCPTSPIGKMANWQLLTSSSALIRHQPIHQQTL